MTNSLAEILRGDIISGILKKEGLDLETGWVCGQTRPAHFASFHLRDL